MNDIMNPEVEVSDVLDMMQEREDGLDIAVCLPVGHEDQATSPRRCLVAPRVHLLGTEARSCNRSSNPNKSYRGVERSYQSR